MPARPKSRNWNDVQTAIAIAAIVTTLGLWNLFATPAKTEVTQTEEPVVPPPTEPPVEAKAMAPLIVVPTTMPYVKIMFTPGAPQPTLAPQVQQQQQVQAVKKKKNKNRSNSNSSSASSSSGGGSVTKTKTS